MHPCKDELVNHRNLQLQTDDQPHAWSQRRSLDSPSDLQTFRWAMISRSIFKASAAYRKASSLLDTAAKTISRSAFRSPTANCKARPLWDTAAKTISRSAFKPATANDKIRPL